jgi:hypothetical protein
LTIPSYPRRRTVRAVKTIEKDEEILVSYKSNKVPGTYLNRVGFVPWTKIMCI